jgi:hypothetical protein
MQKAGEQRSEWIPWKAFKMSALFIGVTYECINLWVVLRVPSRVRVSRKACWTHRFVFIDFHSIKWKLEREKKLHKNILTSHSKIYIVFVHYSHFGIIFTKYKIKSKVSRIHNDSFSTTFIQLIFFNVSNNENFFQELF